MKALKRNWLRAGGGSALFVALFLMTGDRALTAPSPQGIDPLEVLDLQVKPNVIVFLDSSGTFRESPQGGINQNFASGDWSGSKLFQMKAVFKQLIQDNEKKANFLLGQFAQANSVLQNTDAGQDRFFYTTTSVLSPSMTSTELTLVKADATDTTARGLQAWQDIRNQWNTLYFGERVGASTVVCAASVASQLYTSGAGLASALQTAMNGCGGRGATPNVYYVAFDGTRGRFSFGVCTGTNAPQTGCSAGGANQFQMRWADTPNSIAGALARNGIANTGLSNALVNSGNSYGLLRRTATDDGTDTIAGTPVTTYRVVAGRFFNGETYDVLSDGTLCGQRGTATPTNPPTVSLQLVGACGGSASGTPVVFSWSGGVFGGNTTACAGFQTRVPLQSCDTNLSQVTLAAPIIEREIPLSASGTALQGYSETQDGTWRSSGSPATTQGGITADGSTPLAAAMQQIAALFNTLWTTGQTPGPPVLSAINTHTDPKEQTIVLLVTDASGADNTCSHGTEDEMLLETAYRAQTLYDPIVGGVQTPSGFLTAGSDPASSVRTYVVGFGQATTLLNYIAWGGSGMQRPTTTGGTGGFTRWATPPTAADRLLCQTCTDAFIVPDAATLARTLQGILNQGAQTGQFSAQQSITGHVYEGFSWFTGNPDATLAKASIYNFIVPLKIVSYFTLPGFKGELVAYTSDASGAVAVERWRAGQKLTDAVRTRMLDTTICKRKTAAGAPECTFAQLHAGATEASIGTSSAAIRRRIYTTSQNGTYYSPATMAASLTAGTASTQRRALWPPDTTWSPTTDGVPTGLDNALGIGGLPLNTTATNDVDLQNNFHACLGSPVLPAACTGSASAQLNRARREVREMILAFMAGAKPILDAAGNPKRVPNAAIDSSPAGDILYEARDWMLGESTLGAPAIVSLALDYGAGNPKIFPTEYSTYVAQQVALLPATVAYVPANDMLHAFRAGPGGSETGGEELWGFVPYDTINVLMARYLNQPQKRDPHDYMLTAPVRFGDVFVPGSPGTWRVVLTFGRGIAGNYYTALDVTPRASGSTPALQIPGPLPLWNRGNPDTLDGFVSGTPVRAADTTAYATMGQTWSVPALALVDKTLNTTLGAGGRQIDFVMMMGSGYAPLTGATAGQGASLYVVDALTGDMISAASAETAAAAAGMQRLSAPFPNSIPAGPSFFVESGFTSTTTVHPAAGMATRGYVGDVHGHYWKMVTANPSVLVPIADLGADQPVATSSALHLLPDSTGLARPNMFVTSGNDKRVPALPDAGGTIFKIFGFRDMASDTDIATTGTTASSGVTTFAPSELLFARNYGADVGSTSVPTARQGFRGTGQPLTLGSGANGFVLFLGTRFNVAGSDNAPVGIPCRSSFDSIVYLVKATDGASAFDLNASGDDSFAIFTGDRIVAVGADYNPASGAPRLTKDESKVGAPTPPMPPGAPATVQGGGVILPSAGAATRAGAGFPGSYFKLGSAVCQ